MALLATLLTLTLPAAVAADEATPSVLIASSVERLPLAGKAPLRIEVDSLGRLVVITAPPRILRQLATRPGTLCPRSEQVGGSLVLHCQSNRLDVAVRVEGNRRHLEIRELRGLPWRTGADGPPIVSYLPPEESVRSDCQASEPAFRGECQFLSGNLAAAAHELEAALETDERTLAALRLGDIALSRNQLPEALVWFGRVGQYGPYARLAAVRVCELVGNCSDVLYQHQGLSAALRQEMLLRHARSLAFEGRLSEAMGLLREVGDQVPPEAVVLVRRIVLEGLRDGSDETAASALTHYVSLLHREKGPLAVPMASAAAELAARFGAPAFGANQLAAVVPAVDTGKLGAHLRRAAELYLQAGDRVRARVMADYAKARMSRRELATWTPIFRALDARTAIQPATSTAQAAKASETDATIAQALSAAARARRIGKETP